MDKIRKPEEFCYQNGKDIKLGGLFFGRQKRRARHLTLMIAGYKRAATEYLPYLELAKKLKRPSLLLDFPGVGMSAGAYEKNTVKSMLIDLSDVRRFLYDLHSCEYEFQIVAHSLGACVVALDIGLNGEEYPAFRKAVLLAPALNQRVLFRYWYARSLDQAIDFKDHGRIIRGRIGEFYHWFPNECHKYIKESRNEDYQKILENIKLDFPVLHVHGDSDNIVPISSVTYPFNERIIVRGGGYDLDRPVDLAQWLSRTADFLNS